jgi:ribosomal-protein-serine acetyltransferase
MPGEVKAARGLILKPLQLKDAAALFLLVDANRERLRRWLPWLDANRSKVDSRAYILQMRILARQQLALSFGLWWKGHLVGVAGFNRIDHTNQCAAIGYWLGAEAEGYGLMTAAVAALIRHGFRTLKLNRIEIRAAVRNRRSRAVAERLGFRHEGTLRQAERLYDRFVDHAMYGLLAVDWASPHPPHR